MELQSQIEKLGFLKEGDYIEMAFTQHEGMNRVPQWLIDVALEISLLRGADIVNVMVNRMPPRRIIPLHSDTLSLPYRGAIIERWHLPIVTAPGCLWFDSVNGTVTMPMGKWSGPVPYWEKHNFVNDSSIDRIHVVVDLNKEIKL